MSNSKYRSKPKLAKTDADKILELADHMFKMKGGETLRRILRTREIVLQVFENQILKVQDDVEIKLVVSAHTANSYLKEVERLEEKIIKLQESCRQEAELQVQPEPPKPEPEQAKVKPDMDSWEMEKPLPQPINPKSQPQAPPAIEATEAA